MRYNNNAALSPFVTTVGTDQTLTKPLLDAETGGVTRLCYGPEYRRHNLRFFIRMPSLKEAETLPVPMGHDRSSVTFEPYMLVMPNPMPSSVTAEFYRIIGPEGPGKVGKRKLHLWTPEIDTAIYPSLVIHMPTMKPDDTLELHGTSFWHNPRRRARSPQAFVDYPPGWDPPPPVTTYTPLQILVMIRMKWLPNGRQRHRTDYVHGSPLHAPAPPAPPLYGEPERQRIEPGAEHVGVFLSSGDQPLPALEDSLHHGARQVAGGAAQPGFAEPARALHPASVGSVGLASRHADQVAPLGLGDLDGRIDDQRE